ncbi:MAG: lysoplasmalogenase, partial [Anaerolineales bacterium]|nr:lysoplasmalogenase [Anaerolineales bacterium]
KRTLVYIFKPLTTLLIIMMAVLIGSTATAAYKWLIAAGLILCLAGDIFLMLPPRYFLAGLGSFLAGHWFYIAAFTLDGGAVLTWWLLPLLIYGVAIHSLLRRHLGKMRWPVIVYIIFILAMAWAALGRWSSVGSYSAALAAIGALLFVISDSVLAYDRFRQKFPAARVVVLSTYWAAQWLIAYSVINP